MAWIRFTPIIAYGLALLVGGCIVLFMVAKERRDRIRAEAWEREVLGVNYNAFIAEEEARRHGRRPHGVAEG